MSFQAMTWATEKELPCNFKMVLLMLANRTNHDTGRCDQCMERLARDCGLSVRTVQRSLKELEGRGLIEVIERKAEGINLPNHYRLLMDIPGRGGGDTVTPGVTTCLSGVVSHSHQGGVTVTPKPGNKPISLSSSSLRSEEDAPASKKNKKRSQSSRSTTEPPPERPDDVSEQTWKDLLKLREAKNAPVTDTVLKSARKEATKAGLTLEEFLEIWCLRGSQGLQADWLNKPSERAGPRPQAPKQKTTSITENFQGKIYEGTPIDDLPPDMRDAALAALSEG